MTSTTEQEPPPTCPGCGEPYGENWIAHEIQGVYDGILYWECAVCHVAWSRDWSGYGRRGEIAQQYVDQHNSALRERLGT